jgi:hypothetical protein
MDMDTETYQLHQTPNDCAKDLIATLTLQNGDRVLEPFKGEGSFYNNFPNNVVKEWAEIRQGRDYKDVSGEHDWIITNPPYRLETEEGNRVNSFWFLLDYYTTRAKKGIAFLANDRCFSTLTPRRMEIIKNRGWSISKITVCSVKKWRGRYFFVVFEKNAVSAMNFLKTNY